MQFLSMSLSLAPFAGWASAPDEAVIPKPASVKEYSGSLHNYSLQARSFDMPEEAPLRGGPVAGVVRLRSGEPDR